MPRTALRPRADASANIQALVAERDQLDKAIDQICQSAGFQLPIEIRHQIELLQISQDKIDELNEKIEEIDEKLDELGYVDPEDM